MTAAIGDAIGWKKISGDLLYKGHLNVIQIIF